MICVTASYRWVEGANFNHDYYHSEHMKIARALLTPHGLRRLTSHRVILRGEPKPGAVIAVTHAYFDSMPEAQQAVALTASQLMADVPNYTNIRPESAVFEVLEQG